MIAHRIIWSLGFLAVFLAYRRIYGGDRNRPTATLDTRLSVESFRPVYLLVFYSSAVVCVARPASWPAAFSSA